MAAEIRFSVDGFDAEAAGDLWRWLSGVDELRGRVRLVDRPMSASQAAAQAMGPTVADTVAVGLGAGGAISVLAQALVVWLRQPRGLAIRLKVTRPDGGTAELSVDRADDAAAAEALVRAALGLGDPGRGLGQKARG